MFYYTKWIIEAGDDSGLGFRRHFIRYLRFDNKKNINYMLAADYDDMWMLDSLLPDEWGAVNAPRCLEYFESDDPNWFYHAHVTQDWVEASKVDQKLSHWTGKWIPHDGGDLCLL